MGSDIQRLSNDLQNLNQGVAASSQARTLEKSLEESNKFTQQEIELNRRVTENHQKQSGEDRNTDKLAATQIEQKNTNERFKDSLTTTLEQKKDQEVNADARELNNEQQRSLLAQSNQATQNAFTMGVPANASSAVNLELGKVDEAATPDERSGRSLWITSSADDQLEGNNPWTGSNTANNGNIDTFFDDGGISSNTGISDVALKAQMGTNKDKFLQNGFILEERR